MYLTYLLESQIHANQNIILECCSSETGSDCKALCTSFSCVHHEACARRDLDKVLGLRQWDYSRYMNGLRSLDGSITKLTHCGISRSFPHSQLESPRFQDVALFTEKQFVRKGLPSHLPTLILHLILLGPLFSFSFSQVTYQRVFWFFAQNDLGPVSLPLCNAFRFREDLVSSFLSQSTQEASRSHRLS